MVAKLPERKKAMTRNATKKMMAVPKSFSSARQPQITAEYAINRIRFRFAISRCSVEAPAKIKQILASSDG